MKRFPLSGRQPRRSLSRWGTAFLIFTLGPAACGGPQRTAPTATPAPPQPIPAEWANPSWGAGVKGGWTVRNCSGESPSLCVQKDGKSAGTLRLKDLPSLGEEKTTSSHQVQAVLAGRINSLYQFKIGRWANACGKNFEVTTSRPRQVAMGEARAMKYELAGNVEEKVAERLVGYWAFRDGIETVIEASAATPERCREEPLGQVEIRAGDGAGEVFQPEILRSFEPILDRMVAGSRLPPPTQFTAGGAPSP